MCWILDASCIRKLKRDAPNSTRILGGAGRPACGVLKPVDIFDTAFSHKKRPV